MSPAPEAGNQILEGALWYVRNLGWKVFPVHTVQNGRCSCGTQSCRTPGKHPRTQHGVYDATSDEGTIRKWWARWPDANLALATGEPSGVDVLDVDPRHYGNESLYELERRHGQVESTVMSLTGGGGSHTYFQHATGVKNLIGDLGEGLDLKTTGGYVLLPPSLHESGRRYTWEGTSHPAEVAIAPFPEWLLKLALPQSHNGIATPKAPIKQKIPTGERNKNLTSLAGSMRRRGMDSEIEAALAVVNERRCEPPLPAGEVHRIAEGIARYEPQSAPRTENQQHVTLAAEHTKIHTDECKPVFPSVELGSKSSGVRNPRRNEEEPSRSESEVNHEGRSSALELPRLARQQANAEEAKLKDPLADTKVGLKREKSGSNEPVELDDGVPEFPELAWRGTFRDYRDAMRGSTEASDVVHFATLWAGTAVALGRRVCCYAGDWIYPNVFLNYFGPTGDKKTTAERRLLQCGLLSGIRNLKVISNVGSTEGLADAMSGIAEDNIGEECLCLLYWEELSALMARGRWSGSTIFEFMVETFDCPSEWGLNYRKKPVHLSRPTPTILTATTPAWFWKEARHEDFYGGFGNRFFLLSGNKKEPLPQPTEPNQVILDQIRKHFIALSQLEPAKFSFSPEANELWSKHYLEWEKADRSPLLAAAVKRIPVYVRKLVLAYAADEGTGPMITFEQLRAAIAVGKHAEKCTAHLLALQTQTQSPVAELEERFVRWVENHPGERVRYMQQTLSKYTSGAELFNKVLKNLIFADRLFIRDDGDGRRVCPPK